MKGSPRPAVENPHGERTGGGLRNPNSLGNLIARTAPTVAAPAPAIYAL